MSVVTCKNVYLKYSGVKEPVINNVSLDLAEGCFVSIMGRSGSGKSTLLKLMCGLLKADSGEIITAGNKLSELNGKARAIFRSQTVGIIFQDNNLIDDFNVKDNILAPLYIAGKKADLKHFQRLLELTELNEFVNRMPHQLSGGQKQRVAIARALIAKPQIIFADEPTGSLDSASEQQIMALFKAINEEFGIAIVQVTHSMECAKAGKALITINDGKVNWQ
ncbi:MAG: ABC transporter ATP-binding protein [Erysipelotrichales bacterium]|nr:ABC transporter ATP-binding protein [Erysipelotrichales bacterium]